MNLIIIGGNSGSRLCFDIAMEMGYKSIYFFENFTDDWGSLIIKKDDFIQSYEEIENKLHFDYFIATGDNLCRSKIYKKFMDIFKKPPVNLIHPSAIISKFSKIGFGNLICPGNIINNNTVIGNGNILNTGSIIEHDNVIGNFSQISPNVTLCGYVSVGNYVFVGAGVTIIPKISIPSKCIIGAGSVVIRNPNPKDTIAGIPAKSILKKK